MHVFGAFELDIQPGTPDDPESIRVALLRYVRGENGRLFITPECTSFEEVEGQLCQRRFKSRPRGGAKLGQWGRLRHGGRADHIAGACHGALAPWANCHRVDFRTMFAICAIGYEQDGSSRRSSRGC